MTPEELADLEREEARVLARVAELEAERDGARAEVERLRRELAARTDELDDAMRGWKNADTEAEQARAQLAKVTDHRAYLQGRLRKAQKEAAGRKQYGEWLRTELRDRRTDDLDIRGILKPAPGVGDPAVPMPLGPALAPAIEWLVNDRDRLRLQLESAEQERDAARGVAKGRTELADQMRTERDAAREQVKRVREEHPRRDDPTGPVCGGCGLDAYEESVPWPCPTISALDGTEPGR